MQSCPLATLILPVCRPAPAAYDHHGGWKCGKCRSVYSASIHPVHRRFLLLQNRLTVRPRQLLLVLLYLLNPCSRVHNKKAAEAASKNLTSFLLLLSAKHLHNAGVSNTEINHSIIMCQEILVAN